MSGAFDEPAADLSVDSEADLEAERLALLELLLEEEAEEAALAAGGGAESPSAPQAAERVPLSLSQRRLWIADRLDPGTPLFNIPASQRLTGPLDLGALRSTLQAIVDRHEALRTTFSVGESEPGGRGPSEGFQVIARARAVELPRIDLRGLPLRAAIGEAVLLSGREQARGFDLERGPLLRLALVEMAPDDHVLLATMHHIIADGWSLGIFQREFSALYAGFARNEPVELPPLPIQYADFALWQRDWLRGEVLEKQLTFWREHLAGAPFLAELPTDRPRPRVRTFRGGKAARLVAESVVESFQRLARGEGVTYFASSLALGHAWLGRLSGSDDALIGSPIAGRHRIETEGVIGFFVSNLVFRAQLRGDPTAREVLVRTREETLAILSHQDVPFDLLVEALAPERDLSTTPVYQVQLMAFDAPKKIEGEDAATEAARPRSLGDLGLSPLLAGDEMSLFDLSMSVAEGGRRLALQYNSSLFDPSTVERLVGYFENLMVAFAADPGRPLSEIAMIGEDERRQLLLEWNPPFNRAEGEPFARLPLLPEWVSIHARNRPGAIAVEMGEGSLTYAELDLRSDALARYLSMFGVGAEVRVGLCLERSLDLVVALIAVQKAGGAYLPLDPSYPIERLAGMVEDAGLMLLLAQDATLDALPAGTAYVINLDRTEEMAAMMGGLGSPADLPPLPGPEPEHLAYVIYTSGSTGKPKGVMLAHDGLANLCARQAEIFAVGPESRVLQFASVSFDASVAEIAVALYAGATLVLATRDELLPGPGLVRLLQTRRISKATIPPSALAVLPAGTEGELPDLATLVVAGEACSPDLAALWSRGRRFVNAYGPTEATVCAASEVYGQGRALTLGGPLADVEIHVLGPRFEPLPVGVSGELLIGGRGLARGYLNRPELSAERFVPHPFAAERNDPGARLYRSGDLVRRLADGRVEFLGRIDHQVKVRGFRIELGEIESALRAQAGVKDVVVLARNDAAGPSGGLADRLVAYLLAEPDRELVPADLKAALAARLPDYMVPAAFVALPAFPLTANGKVDRKALPAPELAHLHVGGVRHEAPRDAIESLVAEIFAEVLSLPGEVSIHDSFFDLGGHSLLATQLLSRVRDAFAVELPLRQVFEAQTVASFSRAIERAQREARGLESGPIEPRPRAEGTDLPLSFAQERLWFLDQLEPGSPTYNIPTALKVRGALDPARLAAALRYLERRHESLRTTFPTRDGRAVQEIAPPDAERGTLLFARVDLGALSAARGEIETLRLAAAEAIRPFDLASGPLGRVVLVHLVPPPTNANALLLTVHHVISDGWSMGVFVRELAEVHSALVEGREPDPKVLPPLPIQYADFAAWQRAWLSGEQLARQIEHWRGHLLGAPELLALPTDRPRPAIQSYRGASVARASAPGSVERLHAFSRGESATLFMTLLGVWSTLLYRYTGQTDIPVGTPIANRNRAEVEGLIGFFVNTLVLRTRVVPLGSFRSLLSSVRESTLEGYAHQDLPFEKLVEAIAPQRNLSYSPLFQSMLVLQNNPDRPLELPGLELSGLGTAGEVSKFDLTLNAIELGPRLACRLVYSSALFEPATVERILGHLHALIEAVLEEPDRPVGSLDFFTREERRALLVDWNEPAVAHPTEGYLPQMFEERVDAGPERVAVEFDDRQRPGDEPSKLTYAELDVRANRLARHLRALGVGPETRVGVCLERSLDLPVALLAVLKAGAAYLPLDPTLPEDRLRYLVEDATAPVVLTIGRFVERLGSEGEGVRLVLLDDGAEAAAIAAESAERLLPAALSEHPAYVIYTSGSTGKPKGVVISHRALGNRLRYAIATDFQTIGEAFLQKTTISFDVSVLEIFAPLVSGGRTVLPEPEGHRDPAYLVRLIAERRITQASFPPSTLALLLDSGALDECRDLRLLVTGGETVPADLPGRVHERLPWIDVYNRYGPTETTISVTSWLCRPDAEDRSLPIGRPTAGAAVYLLDRHGEPVPVGVAGELHLGGLCLARGYLGRPETTAAAFVPNPFSAAPGERLYATGDLAKWRADGAIEFVGRIDGQIKIRGFRVELGEIEAALHREPGVREAAVVDREDSPGQKRLVAYFVAEPGATADLPRTLRERLAEGLPAYMVPAAFVALPSLPLSPTGKIDRKALPAPPAEVATVEGYAPPRTETEALLASVWAEVLGLVRVGIHDNYFALGGDSILSIQIVARAAQAGCRIAPRQLFQHQTVAELAAVAGTVEAVEAEQGEVVGAAPLSPIQRWFFAADRPDRHWFNQSFLLKVERSIEPAAVERAVAELARHHDALRLRFREMERVWTQDLAPAGEAPFESVDLSAVEEGERRAALEARTAALEASLDLEAGPIFRTALFDLGEEEPRRLLLAIHHLAVDGVSWRILLEDLERLLSGRELPKKTTSWKAWTERLAASVPAFLKDAALWLARPETSFRLPVEPGGGNLVSAAQSVAVSFDPEETRRLLESPAAYRAQVQDLLLAALQSAIGGDLAVPVELEGHGREEDLLPGVDLTRTVGWFTTLYPVVLEAPAGAAPGERLQSIKERLRTIPSRGLSHGVLRWLGEPEIQEALAAFPSPEISFNYLGQADASARGAGAATASVLSFARENPGPTLSPRATRSHELAVSAVVSGGSLRVEWIFGSERLARATVESWAASFREQALRIAEHCASAGAGGYTPSDFPLARLDAAGLKTALGDSRGIADLYPLSPLQEGLLFLAAQAPGSSAYFEQLGTEILGALDERAFAAAWAEVVAAHPVLRTSLRWRGLDRPLQAVHEEIPKSLSIEDWTATPPEEIEARERAFLAADRSRGFALARPPLARALLARLGAERRFFVFSFHHVLLDGWSFPLVVGDLFAAYGALARGERPALPPRRPYRDYVAWLAEQDLDRAERFFSAELAGIEAPTPIAIASLRPARAAETSDGVGEVVGALSRAASDALSEQARSRQLTANTLVQGAWSVLLARTAGTPDVVYGTTVSGRPAGIEGVERMVGLFINTLPVRATVHPETPFSPWLAAFQERLSELRDVEHASLVAIRRWSAVPGHLPLFESLLIFENAPRGEAVEESAGMGAAGVEAAAGGLRLSALRFFERTSYPVTAVAAPGRELSLRLSYDPARVEPEAAERLFGWWKTLLGALAEAGEGTRLGDLPLLSAAEREEILRAGVGPRPAGAPPLVAARIAAQAARTPAAVAVVAGGEELSYADLVARANRLAWRLVRLGVGTEAKVGIAVERSLSLPVAALGVLEAGAAYVPLDPSYPEDRLAYMAKDAGLAAVIASPDLASRFASFAPELVALRLDGEMETAGSTDASPYPSAAAEENLAYVIYTSGSTGRPKGVELSHGALGNFLAAMIDRPGIAPADVLVSVTSLSFDIAGLELYAPLMVGARVVIARRDEVADGRRLAALLESSGATVLQATPSGWRVLLASGWTGRAGLKGLVGGEALPPALARELSGKVDSLWNMYGPTETAVWSTLDRVDDGPITIGRPIDETFVYVVDAQGDLLPPAVLGELWIGGAGVARGYHGRPDLSAERFLPDGFRGEPGARLYRTGDLARWRFDGRLEALGRIDSQVKVRGHRIELQEIEAVLGRHPGVAGAAVAVVGEGEERRIAAYVVPRPGEALAGAADGASLREALAPFLLERLPESMLPSVFVRLDALPLTPNGKVDKKALPLPGVDLGAAATPPRTLLERRIAEIWESLLGVSGVGLESHFFALGGHSLLAMRLASRLREAFGLELPLDAVFASPDLRGFAARVEAALDGTAAEAAGQPPLVPVPRDGALPLSFAQTRLYLLERLAPGNPFYNLGGALRLPGRLDGPRFAAAVDLVARRQESLRTSFSEIDRTPVQIVHPEPALRPYRIDVSALPDPAAHARRLAARQAATPFDLGVAPLLSLWLVRLAPDDQLLLYTMHHVISDGWSMGLLVAEITAAYRALEAGEAPDLPALPVQYADFAAWQRAWFAGGELERQLAYWRERLAALPATELPADRPRPPVSTYRGRRFETALDSRLAAAVGDLAREAEASAFMVLLAGFEALVARWIGQDEVVLGTPVANRRRREVEGLIGFFVNTLVLRTDLSGDPSFRVAVGRTKEMALGAFAHQDLPFERLVEELSPRRDLSRNPLFQLMFNLINTPREAGAIEAREGADGHSSGRSLGAEAATALFDLQLYLIESGGSFRLHWEYATDLFEAATVERFARAYETLLSGAATSPAVHLSDLPILAEAERTELIALGRGPAAGWPRGLVHEGVAAQAARTPSAVAVVAGGEELTYAELAERSRRLARRLRSLGVGVETRVGLAVERTLALPVAALGVLTAGAAYVPLDPAYPAERLAYMAENAGLAAVVVSADLAARFSSYAPVAIAIDDRGEIEVEPDGGPVVAELAPAVSGKNLAYTLYTSGSTGRPKGVEVSHEAFWNLQQTLRERPGIGAGDVLVSVTSLSFDIAGFELFGPLLVGGRTVIARREEAVVGEQLGALLDASGATILQATPSGWRLLLASGWAGRPGLKALAGGEALAPSLVEALSTRVASLWNGYGPTETAVYSTFSEVFAEPRITIGRAVGATATYVVDRFGGLLPLGVPGELWIGGAGVARGYRGRPELTAERFLPDPFSDAPGARLYRTGDLVRRLSNGDLDYLGRIDTQVKVRGFRIESGEVEAVLAAHPRVAQAVVVARPTGDSPSAEHELVAYYVERAEADGEELSAAALRAYLKDRLPDYMVPAHFVALAVLPTTPNGKIDRKALPDPARPGRDAAPDLPGSGVERQVAAAWTEVLRLSSVSLDDNFFDLGGHSLAALKVQARLEEALGRKVPFVTLFKHPTIRELALALGDGEIPAAASLLSVVVPIQPSGTKPPLFVVHPVGGTVFFYRDLARALGPDQPVWGLQSRGLAGDGEPIADLEAMAAFYLDAIEPLLSGGPVHLAGASMGGTVVYEMARQLAERGVPVGLVALFDTPGWGQLVERDSRAGTLQLVQMLTEGRFRIPIEELEGLDAEGQMDRIWAEAQSRGISTEGVTRESLGAFRRVIEANLDAMANFPERPYEGRLLYCRAEERTSGEVANPELPWLEAAQGGVELHVVPGDHLSMLRPPNVARIAEILRRRMEE